jgi:competence protein ComEC
MADAAIAGGGLGAAPRWALRLFHAAATAYAAEDERRLLWLRVLFGVGIGVYFSLTFEPPLWLGIGGTVLAGSLTFALYRRPLACEAALALTLLCAGFALIGETT